MAHLIDQEEEEKRIFRIFIAVSKRCCYLCELYIKFAQRYGYNIVVSGFHKKIYHLWKLPRTENVTFNNESLVHIIREIRILIRKKIAELASERTAMSDSDAASIGSELFREDDEEFIRIKKEFKELR